jgi:hypothetical protein
MHCLLAGPKRACLTRARRVVCADVVDVECAVAFCGLAGSSAGGSGDPSGQPRSPTSRACLSGWANGLWQGDDGVGLASGHGSGLVRCGRDLLHAPVSRQATIERPREQRWVEASDDVRSCLHRRAHAPTSAVDSGAFSASPAAPCPSIAGCRGSSTVLSRGTTPGGESARHLDPYANMSRVSRRVDV